MSKDNKNDLSMIEKVLSNRKIKKIALLAPSFVSDFSYPQIINELEKLGFDAVVELTFGAKMINREYHKQLKTSKKLLISTVCPGIVELVKKEYPQFVDCLIKVDSPMIATAKICKKAYPNYKTIFLSPCHYKKLEAQNSQYLDYVIDYVQLKQLFEKNNIKKPHLFYKKKCFGRFYNDYTKIYPLAGGLSKTAHLKQVLKPREEKIIDGVMEVRKFLNNPDKKVRFLDANFCVGGCMGGPCTNNKISIEKKKKLVLKYMRLANKEKIPCGREGLIKEAEGISFKK